MLDIVAETLPRRKVREHKEEEIKWKGKRGNTGTWRTIMQRKETEASQHTCRGKRNGKGCRKGIQGIRSGEQRSCAKFSLRMTDKP